MGIRYITALPFHPQTNIKIERYHYRLKADINFLPDDIPSRLREAIRTFVEYYNQLHYHEVLGNVSPWDLYMGRHLAIIVKKKEAKSRTLEAGGKIIRP